MALSDLVIPTKEIRIGKTSISVRGLGFDDVAILISNNRKSLEQAIEMFGGSSDAQAAMASVATKLLIELPDLVAQVIACACDEPGEAKKVRRLSAPIQLEAILAIGQLTFEETGGVKKFAEQVADIFRSVTAAIPQQAR